MGCIGTGLIIIGVLSLFGSPLAGAIIIFIGWMLVQGSNS